LRYGSGNGRDVGHIGIPRAGLGRVTIVEEVDQHFDGVSFDIEDGGVVARGDFGNIGQIYLGNSHIVSSTLSVELVSTNGRLRNLRTYVAEDIKVYVRIILSPVGKLSGTETKVIRSIFKEDGCLKRVEVLAIDSTKTVDIGAVTGTPTSEVAGSCGIGVAIRVVDVEVRTADTGVNCHIIGVALTGILENVVEHMDTGRVLATEGTCRSLSGTRVEASGVVVHVDMTTERINPDARRGKGGYGCTI
jgi:hypothetical protein